MNESYGFDHIARTFGVSSIAVGLLSSATLGMLSGDQDLNPVQSSLQYGVAETNPTAGLASIFFDIADAPIDRGVARFEIELSNSYERLQGAQVSLGNEFEKVLTDNLLDLYSRS